MSQINWQQFGLKKDPYGTHALVEGGDLSIEKAFVGREREKDFLNRVFESYNRLSMIVGGDVGVGKTSLVNFHKFLWKYQRQKLLFSFRREIEASTSLLNKNSFLIEIISSVIREIKLIQPDLLKHEFISKLNQIIDITQTINFSGGLTYDKYGINFGKEKNHNMPIQLPIATLEDYFCRLVDFIKNNEIGGYKYSGLIIHVNNFDVVLSGKKEEELVRSFFNEIRDLMQTPNTYFIFLGPKNFFENIINNQKRVKSVFVQTPLLLEPLSKAEIINVLHERMYILQSDHVRNYIKPFDDAVIFKLYDIYNGDIRLIMSALHDILSLNTDKVAQTLSVNEAMVLLSREKWYEIDLKLTKEQKRILEFFISSSKTLSQFDISEKFKKPQSNISQRYFKPLREMGIIESKEEKNNVTYWGLSPDYECLKIAIEAQKKIEQKLSDQSEQLSLFK